MHEMDLSGRHETVEYRPNPWSIARINAVTRSSLPKPATTGSSGPSRPPKSQPKPIVEAFKKQAQREPRMDRQTPPVIDNYVSDGGPRVDKPTCATTAGKSHQGSVRDRTLALAQPRVGPDPAPLVDPHSTHQKLKSKSTTRVVETLEKGKLTHIAPSSNILIESVRAPTSVKPRRVYAIPGGTHSSPLRCAVPRSPSDIGDRLGPTFHRSSPGGPSHVSDSTRAMPRLPLASTPLGTTPLVSSTHRSTSPLPPFHEYQKTASNWPLDARNEAADTSPPSAPPHPLVSGGRQNTIDLPHIRTPDPPRRRLVSPDPARAPKKSRMSVLQSATRLLAQTSTSQRCPSAYAFGEDDDPDAEWSTLARTKRAPQPCKIKQSGHFRLPIPGLAPRTPVRVPEAKRRVITYMPPPMTGKKPVDDVDSGIARECKRSDKRSIDTRSNE
ncbi:hypothetical protein JVU11DRAFT_7767 [Chiua virens]|nr:hypothetical protein JVU11DRAFT_7767 [Chiua virens]